MRRHAKAMLAGLTSGCGDSLAVCRIASAPRGVPSDLPGSSATSAGRLGLAASAIAAALLVAIAILAATATPAVADEHCPNEIRRQEQGVLALALPECRAFEIVSRGTYPHMWSSGDSRGARVNSGGDMFQFNVFYPGDFVTNSGMDYLSRRTPNGWVPEVNVPQQSPYASYKGGCETFVFYTEDFSYNIFEDGYHGWYEQERQDCKESETPPDPDAVREYRNLYLHNNTTGTYDLFETLPPGETPGNNHFQDGIPSFKTILFQAMNATYTPDDPPGVNQYITDGSVTRLITYMPDGTPYLGPPGSYLGSTFRTGEEYVNGNGVVIGGASHPLSSGAFAGSSVGMGDSNHTILSNAISDDGSKVFFLTAEPGLYMRKNPLQPQSAVAGGVCTEPAKACTVEISKSEGLGPSGGVDIGNSFATTSGDKVFFLSPNKLTPDSTATTGKLDLYEYDTTTEELTDRTVNASEPAGVEAITYLTDDGSHVFFVADGVLAPGALPGDCNGTPAASNFCNLYVLHNGTITFIASIQNIFGGWGVRNMQSSPDGEWLAFQSSRNVTAYDSEGKSMIYLYNTITEELECASCPALGVPPAGPYGALMDILATFCGCGEVMWETHHVSENGQVFFDTEDALTPNDENEAVDVYEYVDGQQYLLSGGRSENHKDFQDATVDGNNVFFVGADPLLLSDVDGAVSTYDVRVNGGFPEPPALPQCEGEACRGAGTDASPPTGAGTAAFQGPGNRVGRHLRDCGLLSNRAKGLSRAAKRLRRLANRADTEGEARRLRRRASRLAKQGRKLSEAAPRCRRANRRASK